MRTAEHIANHFREVFFGGNWTSVNLKDSLNGLSWEQATIKVGSLNTIAALVYHINYYVSAVLEVMRGGVLDAHDKYSFDHPAILSQPDWEKTLEKGWSDAEEFAMLVKQLPDDQLEKFVAEEKYGNYYRNLHGIIEHTHYHLGQIVIIRKLILQVNPQSGKVDSSI